MRISMSELLDHLSLEYTANGNMNCPFCGGKKTLHVKMEDNTWRCNKCNVSGGVLHFYARYVLGQESIPSSKTERGKLSKELQEYMGCTDIGEVRTAHTAVSKPKQPKIPVVSDQQLNAVYSAMAEMPVLRLSEEHKKSLMKRGLTQEAIVSNGYRSMPEDFPNTASYISLYEKEGGDKTRRIIFDKWRYPVKYIHLGLMIAAHLTDKGFDLKGVPGFYKFGESWCFWVNPGILIPTRNLHGEIVIWQVRRKVVRAGDPKYITNHCSLLPGSVTDSVSRCHFPKSNTSCTAMKSVKFTEGPLKADVAVCLSDEPVIFAAVPGINTTKDLLGCVEDFRKAGIHTMQNCFDMDKLTNPNVRNGSERIMQELQEMGMEVQQCYWGERYANYKLRSLQMIAKLRNVPLPDVENLCVFDQLCAVAQTLENANIFACEFQKNNGDKTGFYWEAETKGIDDYYLSSL